MTFDHEASILPTADGMIITLRKKPIPPLPQQKTGVLVLNYVYPRPGAWDPIVAAKLKHPSVPFIAVINPNSGPGDSQIQDYVGGIRYLQEHGIKVLGYVATDYARKDVHLCVSEIVKYLAWYPSIDGIFFDEVSTQNQESYYSSLVAPRNPAHRLMFGNPGNAIPQSYVGIFDNVVIYEGPDLPVLGSVGFECSKVAHDLKKFDPVAVQRFAQGSEYVYVTDQPGPPANPSANTYGVLSPYIEQLAAVLDGFLL